MKITFSSVDLKNIPKDVVTIHFLEKGGVPFVVERDQHRTLHMPVGKYRAITKRSFILLCRKAVRLAREYKIHRFAILFDAAQFPKLKLLDTAEVASLMAQNFEMANFEFTTFRTEPKEGWPEVKEVIVYGKIDAKIKKGFTKGQVIGEYVNKCRELANAPGGDMTP